MRKNINEIITDIKVRIKNNPDILIKERLYEQHKIAIIFSESMTDRTTINDFVLRPLISNSNQTKLSNVYDSLILELPINKINSITNEKDLLYHILSGFTVILIDGEEKAVSIETKGTLNASISEAKNEKTLKGSRDAFTENYQTNIGLIKKRLKTEKLQIHEETIGNIGNSKVGILSLDGIVDQQTVEAIIEKIKKINTDAVFHVNQIVEMISGNEKNLFPTYLATERPDYTSMLLLDGRIAIVLENSPDVAIVPCLIDDFFNTPEDIYSKPINATFSRIIRGLAFFITILTPALYVALTTYNHETIPSKLLINFSIQRDGVPFSTFMEAILMTVTFEILKETDTRVPSSIGSSLSIVGALVLGEAAVTAGIISPIMVIVIAVTSISGLIITYSDIPNAIRTWRILFLISAAMAGIFGIFLTAVIFISNISSIKSFGLPFLAPYAPMIKENLGGSFVQRFFNKYFRRNVLTTKNTTKSREVS